MTSGLRRGKPAPAKHDAAVPAAAKQIYYIVSKRVVWYCKGGSNIVQRWGYEAEYANTAEKEENGLV
jgi:hypothetical protein